MRLTVLNRTNAVLVLPAPVSQEMSPSSRRSFDHINPTDLSRNLRVWESMKAAGAIDYFIGDDPDTPDDFEVVTAGSVDHAYNLYVDPVNGNDENDGTFARAVAHIQRALDIAAAVELSTIGDVVCIHLSTQYTFNLTAPLTYHGTNALQINGESPWATRVFNLTGPVLTVTNATPASLAAYDVSGVYSDLVNQGNSGPARVVLQNLDMGSFGGINTAVRMLGVPGDAGAGLTSFGGLVVHAANLNGAVGAYCRNSSHFAGINLTTWTSVTLTNVAYALFLHSMARHVITTYDSLDPDGQPASGFIFQGGYDVHQWGNLTVRGEESFLIWSGHTDGSVRVYDSATVGLNGYGLTGTEDINDTSTVIHQGGYVGTHVLVEGGASWRGNGVHVQGNLNFAAGAGTARLDGGRYMGSLTDPGVKFVRNAGN